MPTHCLDLCVSTEAALGGQADRYGVSGEEDSWEWESPDDVTHLMCDDDLICKQGAPLRGQRYPIMLCTRHLHYACLESYVLSGGLLSVVAPAYVSMLVFINEI